MILKTRLFTILFLSFCTTVQSQIEQYDYKRELHDIRELWHAIDLPNEVFAKTSNNLSDIRIYGITSNQDTIEAPYLLRVNTEKHSTHEATFRTINTSHTKDGYYFTFELRENNPINQIALEFNQQNFDWKVTLEGSQDQREWFTLAENYRILSIKNRSTDFHFTRLDFPDAKYNFFRVFVPGEDSPVLIKAKIFRHQIIEGRPKVYPVKKHVVKDNKTAKETEIDIELQHPVPVSKLKINTKDTFDYFRTITIKYLVDSFETEVGWKYNYRTLMSANLNSIEENEFKFNGTILQRLKIIIHNQDNQPLTLGDITVGGDTHELIARFVEPGDYFLTYGNALAMHPNYDIDKFTDKIPAELTKLTLGNEQKTEKETEAVISPLFENKIWLWGVMVAVILLLGWFSMKLLRKE